MSSPSHKPNGTSRDVKRAAADLRQRGFRLVRLKPGQKIPFSLAWQNADPAPDQFTDQDNLGVQLGQKSGHLVDIDLDIREARELAGLPCFFGHLPSFRRASLPADAPGHRLVICEDAPAERIAFEFRRTKAKEAVMAAGLQKCIILELRAGKGQTAFPPSVLGEDQLVWTAEFNQPPRMKWAELRSRGGLLSFASLASACYPIRGGRDNFCMQLAGALISLGVEEEIAEAIIVELARIHGDEEDRSGKVRAAAKKKSQGEPITTLRSFLAFVGLEACEREVRTWLQLAQDAPMLAPGEDQIDITNPNLWELTLQIEALLLRKKVGLYRHGSDLVYLRTLTSCAPEEGLWRPMGIPELAVATPKWLNLEASQFACFVRRGPNGRLTKSAPTPAIMEYLSVTAHTLHFPDVLGVTMTPTLSRDLPGYDPETGLLLAFNEGDFPSGPAHPTKEDAREALALLEHPLREFPFIDRVATSVTLSAILCGVVRRQLRTCPLHAFTAPAAGTGKTKLAEIVGIIATGVAPSGISYSRNAEENEKRLQAILRYCDPVFLIDNVTEDLEGDFLCTALTQETITFRPLGLSEKVCVSTRSLFLATGNNLGIRGDLSRRCVICRLDARTANPEERAFDFDATDEVMRDRPSLVTAALTVLRAYIAAGRPVPLKAVGSFENWSLVRGALVWLGWPDPADTISLIKSEDTEALERATLLRAVASTYPHGRRFTVSELGESNPVFKAVAEIDPRARQSNQRVGRILRRFEGVPVEGQTLRSSLNRTKVREYWLEGNAESAAAQDTPM